MQERRCEDCLWRRAVRGAAGDNAPAYLWCGNRCAPTHGQGISDGDGCGRHMPERLPSLGTTHHPHSLAAPMG